MVPIHLLFGVCSGSQHLYSLLIVVLLQVPASYSTTFYNPHQERFAQTLGDYEVVVPSRVNSKGEFITHTLHPHHHIWKRSVDDVIFDDVNHNDVIHYQIPLSERTLVVGLRKNNKLLTPSTVVERVKNKYRNVSDSVFKIIQNEGCHFTGSVKGEEDESRVALATCGGLMGYLRTNGEEYFIEPVRGHNTSETPQHPHIVYRRSALPAVLDITRVDKHSKRHKETCGVSDNHKRAFRNRERWERHNERHSSSSERQHERHKRSISVEKHVEMMVVVDPKMMKHYEDEDITNYVLTVINMVATIFHDASIGNAVNIVIVRIMLLEETPDDLVIMHHADKTLRSFCKWQRSVNFPEDDHPNHHDVAILLTRHNICSRMNEPCSTLGLAQVAGMCQPHRTCSINEDTGLALAFTISHELGHNFGMKHDGIHNKCEAPKGKQYVMAPHLIADSTPMSWSNCSRRSITQFLDRQWGYCLNDEPSHNEYKFPVQPAGVMYDTNHQCRLQYGQTAALCEGIEVIENVCTTLWCRVDNKCSTKLQAAAEGTVCGDNKWCYSGKCVKMGDRPQAINGEWGQWAGWTECTRTCGAGISYSERHCDNPPPSHGGRYCIGERKRYLICNTEPCAEDGPSFRHKQCSDFNYVPYKEGLYEWEPILTPHTPCQLHCKPVDKFFSVMLKDMVTDGTPCVPGDRNMCISGRCRHVGCDWVIDSSAVEDRCGVCYGDGSTCKTVKKQFNLTEKLGYVQATVIPKGARNIRVEEVAAANNFLALKNDQGKYFLNGHWFIQWSGDYEAAGTVVQYRRDGNKEHFKAAGPLKEPLHIMLLLQTKNPGVVYEYTVPKENATDNRSPEFRWEYSDWSHCTVSCGGGTKRSMVVCMEKEAGLVDEMYCNISSKPDDKLLSCNKHLCPARWWTGPWQHCSVTCGKNGIHRRTVICVRSLGPDEQIALEDDACKGLNKPTEVEPCKHKDPCPGEIDWSFGKWSRCSHSNPCRPQSRRVWCTGGEGQCEEDSKPRSQRACSKTKCGQWKAGDWTQCSVSCGEGTQKRQVKCEGGDKCDGDKKLKAQQDCYLRDCPVDTTPELTTASPSTTQKTKLRDNTLATVKMNTDETTSGDSSGTFPETNFTSTAVPTSLSTKPTSNRTSQATKIKWTSNTISGNIQIGIDNKNLKSDDIKLGESTIDIGGKDNSIVIPDSDKTTPHKHRHRHNRRHHKKDKDVVITSKKSKENNVLLGKPDINQDASKKVTLSTKLSSNILSKSAIQFEMSTAKGSNSAKTTASSVPEQQETGNGEKTVDYWWQAGEWGKCSRHCGGGSKTRRVVCVEVKTGEERRDSDCDTAQKPAEQEGCHRVPCLQWQTTDWNQCSATCGYAVQTRHVYCQTPNRCDSREKPPKSRQCHLQPCISWVNGDWSQCSQTCGGGQQVRLVQCVNLTSQQIAQGCKSSVKPRERETCNTDACPRHNAAYSITCESNEMSYRVCKMLKKLNHCDKAYVRAKCCRTCGKHRRNKANKPAIKMIYRR